MSIEETNRVDFTCFDHNEGTLLLAISDPLDWDETHHHLQKLQTKMNNYLRYIESGELFEKVTGAQGWKIKILVYLKHSPPPLAQKFFAAAQVVCQQIRVADVVVEYEVIE